MREADIASDLRAVLTRVDGLPDRDIDGISILIAAGEWAIALETLCTQIYEYDCELDRALRNEVLRLGRQLEVSAGYLLGDPWESPS